MNSIVSAVAVATATAIPNAGAVPTGQQTVSFPDLVERFISIRDRWSAQEKADEARRNKIEALFLAETGMPLDVLRPARSGSPKWQKLDRVRMRIYDENPSPYYDEKGKHIVWESIHDEMFPIIDEILEQKALSLIDLAWQAEALWLSDYDIREGESNIRSLIENIRDLAGPLLPQNGAIIQREEKSVSPIALTHTDPIFAAIEAHRRAHAAHGEAVSHEYALEESLPDVRRRSTKDAWEEKIFKTDDPRWLAALRATSETSSLMDDRGIDLLNITPTTVAGVEALLRYYTETDEELFPNTVCNDDESEQEAFAPCLMRHVADTLRELTAPSAA